MKKLKIISSLLSLMIIVTACSDGKTSDDIYSKIHSMYYDMKSYSASCDITTFTKGGQSTYPCDVKYSRKDGSFEVTSEDMKIHLTKDKTVITKGQNTIESPSVDGDMYIFVNTFFKSYYQSEETLVSVSTKGKSNLHLLESTAVNPTNYVASMKLWLDTETVIPKKMQIIGSDESVTYEIIFNKFTFEK